MKKKWIVLTIAAALCVYTVGVVLVFYFTSPKPDDGADANNAWVRSYTHIDFTGEERTVIYESIGLDTAKLAAAGFPVYRETFMSPTKWRKELHIIELAFENIYCTTSIYVHADEIKWERERNNVTYLPLEVIGLSFDRYGSTFRYEDEANGLMYSFYCSASPDDALFTEFLRVFLNREDA